VLRCRFCHVGFGPADDPAMQEKARAHVAASHTKEAQPCPNSTNQSPKS
jgi:hypothetical protein